MSNSAAPFAHSDSSMATLSRDAATAIARVRAPELARAEPTLASVAPGEAVRVVALGLDDELARWLGAVGIAAGEHVTVLRRAAFGGPIHVRTSAGGEFAVARSLARAIVIAPFAFDAE